MSKYEKGTLGYLLELAKKDGHPKVECDSVLEAKKPKVKQTTEERLVEVLRDFIAENSNIG